MPLARARHLAIAVALSMLTALLTLLAASSPSQAVESPQLIPSEAETAPVSHSGDAMDDPAIWVHPTDPSRSLIMGNDKKGAFETYDLDGSLVQRLAFGSQFWGNVDVRQGVTVNGITHDLVGVVQGGGVRFYSVDPDTRLLSQVTEGGNPVGENGEGFCMYVSPTTQKVYGVVITIQGVVNEFELTDNDANGMLESTTVRTFSVGSEAEGCVADDDTGALYISQEDVALWRYDAEPGGGTTRQAIDVMTSNGGHLVSDIEGLTIADQPDGAGFIFASAQNVNNPNNSYFTAYRRSDGAFIKSFRVSDGVSSDDCDRTDGITVTTADLGPAYPRGMFICQDNNNDAPGSVGNQNLKLLRLDHVVNLDGGEEPPPPPPPPPPTSLAFVGQSTSNVNSTSFTARVPATAQSGDALLLFVSQAGAAALSGPGAGWTQIGRVVDGETTTVWQRVAAAGDAGSTVRFTSGGVFTKVAMTLAAYRGADQTSPVASITGAPEPGSTGSHTTPLVSNTTDGAWRVSYWSDKNNATTRWTAPGGETVRATTVGSGGGRVDTLLTDLPSGLTAGTPVSTGGLTATADAGSGTATTWTILLRPAAPPGPVDQKPVASFTDDCTDLTCTLDGSGSSDAEDSLAGWSWDFGDGTTGTDPVMDHTYATDGTYTVKLTVTDDIGQTDVAERSIDVGVVPPPPPPPPVTFVGQATRNANSTAFTVQVPSSVQAGDALLLFVSQASTTALTGPGSDWTQIGRVSDGEVTTVWRKVATATDAGSAVRVTSGTTFVKVAMTLAAYHGTDPTDPVVRITGSPEPGSTALHTTPSVANDTDGAWRVSYWSDKGSATTGWTAPAAESSRATTAGTGGGRVTSLLTDSGAALTSGAPASTGGLVARASSAASTATMWTILLRPGT